MNNHIIYILMVFCNRIVGIIDGLKFEAKIYDIPAEFGVSDENAIRLNICRDKDSGDIIIYDRGWQKPQSKEYEDIVEAILDYCKTLPPVNEWQLDNGSITKKEEPQ